ncbi:uncharacterized protein [Littorina saxatilis]|uniref:Uncharacterized protein n=1 Tax=Littorina saxatilis TaxID=31220 RepID=A0AAN9GEA9_9CAEN
MVSSLVVSSLVVLLITTSLLFVAFVTSHWLRIGRLNRTQLCSCTRCDCGMWYSCADDSLGLGATQLADITTRCDWFLSAGFPSNALPDWFKATQAMVTIALVTSLSSLLVGICSICAPYNLHRVVTVATTCTAVLLTVSVSVFGAMVSHLDETAIIIEGYDHLPYLSWSYWLAVAATLVAWVTAVCFFFVCRLKCSRYTV